MVREFICDAPKTVAWYNVRMETDVELALEFDGVVAGYPGREVLHGVSFRLRAGERVAMIGPNGAGKSTFIAVATGLLRAGPGSARLFGRDVASLSGMERARLVSVVRQDVESSAPFTVGEVVMMGRLSRVGRWSAPGDDDRAAVASAMEYTDTARLARRDFSALSGGERQRVAIAMALASDAPLMLLDEPTSHLDLRHHALVARMVEELNRCRGLSVMVVAHDLNFAAEYFDRIVLLADGRIVADGSPREVLAPDVIRDAYGCDVVSHRDPDSDCLRIFPKRGAARP